MDAVDGNSLAAIGFLTALEDATHGWFGGYLVLSHQGRPLEFHCSIPVQPSRAQQILYGPTLRPYLLGEVIGPTLVGQAELPVEAVLTDLPDMLSLALLHSGTIACVEEIASPANTSADAGSLEPNSRILGSALIPSLELAGLRLFGSSTCDWNPTELQQLLVPLAGQIELLEPFERIREAIREAQRISEAPTDNELGQSAAA